MDEDTAETQREYQTIDKQIKSLVEKNKYRQNKRIIGQLASPNAQQNTRAMRSILRDCDEQEGRMQLSVYPAGLQDIWQHHQIMRAHRKLIYLKWQRHWRSW